MAVRWRIAILLAVITTINYVDRSVFGVVAPVIRGEFNINDADYGLITSGFLFAYAVGQLIQVPWSIVWVPSVPSAWLRSSGVWRLCCMP